MVMDMGESLGASWLKHVKKCFVVQANWKASRSWGKNHCAEVGQITKTVSKLFQERYGARIFKDNKNVEQIERQTECDIIGISKDDNGNNRYHVLEMAVHTNGLHYSGTRKGKKANVSEDKVIAKLFNAAMALYTNLDVTKADIIFATPFVNEKLKKRIVTRLKDLQDHISRIDSEKGGRFAYHFSFIGNEDFATRVLEPTCKIGMRSSDVSECFLRAVEICAIAKTKPWLGRLRGAPRRLAGEDGVANAEAQAEAGVQDKVDDTVLEFLPQDINAFKQMLMRTQHAQFALYVHDEAKPIIKEWNAATIRATTNIMNNVKSRPFWKRRRLLGLRRVVVTIVE